MKKIALLFILNIPIFFGWAQEYEKLPVFDKQQAAVEKDWLVEKVDAKANLYRTADGKLVLSNGIVSRTFSIKPNGATVGLEHLVTNESFLRSVRPEGQVVIDGIPFDIGGLTGQPIHNYLLPEWLEQMDTDPSAFQLINYEASEIKPRFDWKKRMEWMPRDLPWPPEGKMLTFHYQLNNEAIRLLKPIPDQVKQNSVETLSCLKSIRINVHYEIYDGLPLLCKWFTLENQSDQQIRVDRFKSEILAVTEPESSVGVKQNWMYPNISVETDYTFGGGMSSTSNLGKSVYWEKDSLYRTQVNYQRVMPLLLECKPQYGPAQKVNPGDTFESLRTWELLHDSWDRERQGLEKRRMYRIIAPWVTENPILMHVRRADNASVKKAIDQCVEVGFEMVIMTFGSGYNLEDTMEANLIRMKELADYAHSKEIALGGYSLLASRKVGGGNDVEMPEGMHPRFGNSPCLQSEWGIEYFNKLYNFYRETGLDILEHDGSYPGDPCSATHHPGHDDFDDSQWNQFTKIQLFYHWCRANGIYLNVPDWYFLNGSNKTGMGYRETNWSLPRYQQEIIERQNVYDGTWEKTPSMGWMFVPLVNYHGGGPAATIEPLKEHLPHYGQRLANLFGAGVQACYRGPQLYDAPETKALVKKWVDFYKSHRRILDSDIIHIRRPDGRDYDAILHVDPFGETKGLLMVYNPLTKDIRRTLRVNLYYTGLNDIARISEQDGKFEEYTLDRDYNIEIEVNIPAKSQTWFIIQDQQIPVEQNKYCSSPIF